MPARFNAPPDAMQQGQEPDPAHLVVRHAEQLWDPRSRRSFLRLLGLGGSVVLMPTLFGCDDDDDPTGPGGTGPVTLDLGNDTGILNYAFALEQLEAAFYTAVVASAAFNGMTAEQKEVMLDLRNHEVLHREFLARVLGNDRIGNLALSSGTTAAVTADAATILRTAEMFEDLGVAAYNGAGKYLSNPDNLLVAGKIVSVEARHAAAIRDLREGLGLPGTPPGTRFAGDDVVVPTGPLAGLDVKLEPGAVLSRVAATGIVDAQRSPITPGTQPPARQGTPDLGPPSPTA